MVSVDVVVSVWFQSLLYWISHCGSVDVVVSVCKL